MLGNLEPEEHVMSEGAWLGQLGVALNNLEWEQGDEIVVKIGGSSVSGIDVGDDYNPKWSSPKGTVKYNKDAFIVIENRSRNPFIPSKAPEK
jgi:hypothetical protein